MTRPGYGSHGPFSLSHPVSTVDRMNTPCPCGCGRRLPLSDTQIRDVTIYSRHRHPLDLAEAYNCTVATIKHAREVWRSDGSIAR